MRICDANRALHQMHVHHASFLALSPANRVFLLRFHVSVGARTIPTRQPKEENKHCRGINSSIHINSAHSYIN